jgi:hypothetical protein
VDWGRVVAPVPLYCGGVAMCLEDEVVSGFRGLGLANTSARRSARPMVGSWTLGNIAVVGSVE